jgi:hypothetical protein
MATPPELDALPDELYKRWEQTVGAWWDQVLSSPAALGAAGQGLAGLSQARGRYEQQVDDQLARLHLPTRGDLTRVARICTLLEKRLHETEDHLLQLRDALSERDQRLDRMEKELLQARVDAAEARVELREALAALQQKLDAPPAAPAEGRAPRKPGPARG